jgi:hypothetical protein
MNDEILLISVLLHFKPNFRPKYRIRNFVFTSFCCHKEGHVKKDCPIWKKILKDEAKNSTLKVGVNV